MESTYIISDCPQFDKIAEQLHIKTISFQAHKNEMGFHDWLTREFKNKDIRKIIIPLSLRNNETEGLLLGLHIRLNYELPIEKRVIPLIFLSNLSLENIITKCSFDEDSNPQILLITNGVSISSTDIEEIVEKLEDTKSLKIEEYPLFLKILSINRKSIAGHHDIANAWGCYKLGQIVGFEMSHPLNHGKLSQLYTKLLICKNNAYKESHMKFTYIESIKCQGKRILFIDDKADEGWGSLMQYIFKSAGVDFTYVDPSPYKNSENNCFTDFDGFIAECKSHIGKRWDLIIIDLRLNPNAEDMDANSISPIKLSGFELIDLFLNENKGYPIMVFTASNKIWNVDAAMKRGAISYYIKESPEFNHSISETRSQFDKFQQNVYNSFNRAYLQDIFSDIRTIKKTLSSDDLGDSIAKQLDLAFFLITKAETDEQFAFAYISLYQIVEIITEKLIIKIQSPSDSDAYNWELPNGSLIHDYKWDDENKSYTDIGEAKTTVKGTFPQWKKMAGLIFQQWDIDNGGQLVFDLYYLIEKRNGFIHNDKSIIDKQDIHSKKYLHHDIFNKSGFQKLFNCLKIICSYL